MCLYGWPHRWVYSGFRLLFCHTFPLICSSFLPFPPWSKPKGPKCEVKPPSPPPAVLHLLSDLSLLATFDRLSLRKLLTLDGVSPRFDRLKAEALANRGALCIFVGKESYDYLFHSSLFTWAHSEETLSQLKKQVALCAITVPALDLETVTWLVATFRRVSHLRLVVNYAQYGANAEGVLEEMPLLLEQWPLQQLGIWNRYAIGYSSTLMLRLHGVLNGGLPLLHSLTSDWPGVPFDLKLCLLPRLKLLCCTSQSRKVLNSMNPTDSGQNLPEIRLFTLCDFPVYDSQVMEANLATFLSVPAPVASRVTRLQVTLNRDSQMPQLSAICRRFGSLKWFSLSWYAHLPLRDTLALLSSSLPQLTALELLLRLPIGGGPVVRATPRLAPFANLESLTLTVRAREHTFLDSLGPLDQLFPALKTLKVHTTILNPCACVVPGRVCSIDGLETSVRYLVGVCATLQVKGDLSVKRYRSGRRHQTVTEKVNFSPDSGAQLADWKYTPLMYPLW